MHQSIGPENHIKHKWISVAMGWFILSFLFFGLLLKFLAIHILDSLMNFSRCTLQQISQSLVFAVETTPPFPVTWQTLTRPPQPCPIRAQERKRPCRRWRNFGFLRLLFVPLGAGFSQACWSQRPGANFYYPFPLPFSCYQFGLKPFASEGA